MTAKQIRGVKMHATFYFPDIVLIDGDTAVLRCDLTNNLSEDAVRLLLAGEWSRGSELDVEVWSEAMESLP